jgi:glycolate oxidase
MDTEKIIQALVQAIGPKAVKTEKEDLASYAFDATPDMPTALPDVVVFPESSDHVQAIVAIANRHRVPVYTRGSGTNLSGGTIPLKNGIVMVMLKMNKILEIDVENLTATCEPGVIIADLNAAVGEYGLMYPPDPGSVDTATMGGSVAECSGGLRGLKYGVTKHYIMGLDVILANGKMMTCGGKTVKNVSGYDMVKLFVGAEGTLGVVTRIVCKLIPTPEARKTATATFASIDDAANAVAGIIKSKVIPATLEIMDRVTIQTVENYLHLGLPTEAEAILVIEVDGLPEVVEREAEAVVKVCKANHGDVIIAANDKERDGLLAARRAALPALAQLSPTTVLEDATVPRSKVPEMIHAIRTIADKYDLSIGTFGHAGDGNLHPTIVTDETNTEEMARVHQAVDDIFAAAVEMGGTLSGEHGIGIAKQKYLTREFGEAGLEALKAVKRALDPDNLLNPGKVVSI